MPLVLVTCSVSVHIPLDYFLAYGTFVYTNFEQDKKNIEK